MRVIFKSPVYVTPSSYKIAVLSAVHSRYGYDRTYLDTSIQSSYEHHKSIDDAVTQVYIDSNAADSI